METPFFFENSRYRLFGILHAPETVHAPDQVPPAFQGLGLVFCHPFAEEKLNSHRVMVNLARHLAQRGIWCLRFDYMGHGDSEGNFEDSSVETRLSDIQAAIKHLRSHAGDIRIGLLGIRFGATLAALAAARTSPVDTLILISPIVQGKPYIEGCLRANLTSQMMVHKKILKDRKALIQDLLAGQTVSIDGYLLTKTLYLEIADVDLLKEPKDVPGRVLILQVSPEENKPISADLQKLHERYRDSNVAVQLTNVQELPFWTDTKTYIPRARSMEQTVFKWLRSLPSDATGIGR